jgi:hypothetical protein
MTNQTENLEIEQLDSKYPSWKRLDNAIKEWIENSEYDDSDDYTENLNNQY